MPKEAMPAWPPDYLEHGRPRNVTVQSKSSSNRPIPKMALSWGLRRRRQDTRTVRQRRLELGLALVGKSKTASCSYLTTRPNLAVSCRKSGRRDIRFFHSGQTRSCSGPLLTAPSSIGGERSQIGEMYLMGQTGCDFDDSRRRCRGGHSFHPKYRGFGKPRKYFPSIRSVPAATR